MLADEVLITRDLAPDIVILDEAQRIKNWQTRTAQAVKRLTSRCLFVLTGTPLENRIKRFKKEPDCRLLLCSDAGATGLNLQEANI